MVVGMGTGPKKSQPKISEISALEVYYFKVNTKRESTLEFQIDDGSE